MCIIQGGYFNVNGSNTTCSAKSSDNVSIECLVTFSPSEIVNMSYKAELKILTPTGVLFSFFTPLIAPTSTTQTFAVTFTTPIITGSYSTNWFVIYDSHGLQICSSNGIVTGLCNNITVSAPASCALQTGSFLINGTSIHCTGSTSDIVSIQTVVSFTGSAIGQAYQARIDVSTPSGIQTYNVPPTIVSSSHTFTTSNFTNPLSAGTYIISSIKILDILGNTICQGVGGGVGSCTSISISGQSLNISLITIGFNTPNTPNLGTVYITGTGTGTYQVKEGATIIHSATFPSTGYDTFNVPNITAGTHTYCATPSSPSACTTFTVASAGCTTPLNVSSISIDNVTCPITPITSGLHSYSGIASGQGALIYKWTVDGSVYGTSSNPISISLTSGTHTIGLTVTDSCPQSKVVSCSITVSPTTGGSLSSITLDPTSTSVAIGKTVTISPICKDASGNTLTCPLPITWSISSANIATILNGVITGVSVGTALVTCTISGIVGTSTVIVSDTVQCGTNEMLVPGLNKCYPKNQVYMVAGAFFLMTMMKR